MDKSPEVVPRFQLRTASPADFAYLEALTRTNMIGYYRRHGLEWHTGAFIASCRQSVNFIIESSGTAIGGLRISEEGDALHLRDLQIAAAYRAIGAGSHVLTQVHAYARERHRQCVRLYVFVDNPAVRLYERFGYRIVGQFSTDQAALKCMECRLGQPGGTG
jgi:ribosomal protein S18 acetylase RimI-like enzyme